MKAALSIAMAVALIAAYLLSFRYYITGMMYGTIIPDYTVDAFYEPVIYLQIYFPSCTGFLTPEGWGC